LGFFPPFHVPCSFEYPWYNHSMFCQEYKAWSLLIFQSCVTFSLGVRIMSLADYLQKCVGSEQTNCM
jgi:hypothetical protein